MRPECPRVPAQSPQRSGYSGRRYYTSLLNCQKKVQRIERVVYRFKESEQGRTVVSPFKVALKKEGVLEFERQLGQAIQILDISLPTHSL